METGIQVVRIDPHTGERFQPLRRLLGVSTFGMNLITLRPGERGRIHEHARQEEVMVVLDGILDLVTRDGVTELRRDDAVRIGPEVRRQLVNRGPETTVILALGGATAHEGRDGLAYATFDDEHAVAPQDLPNPDDLPAEQLR